MYFITSLLSQILWTVLYRTLKVENVNFALFDGAFILLLCPYSVYIGRSENEIWIFCGQYLLFDWSGFKHGSSAFKVQGGGVFKLKEEGVYKVKWGGIYMVQGKGAYKVRVLNIN